MKKILSIVAVGFCLMANADYIYWMVDSNPINVNDWNNNPVEVNWTSANLYVDGARIGTMTAGDWSNLDDLGGYAYTSIGTYNPSTSTFMIELIGGEMYGKYSDIASNLASYIFKDNSMSVMPATAFGQGATFAVPEPTSGLLFLVGGMLLGLKRRRQKV